MSVNGSLDYVMNEVLQLSEYKISVESEDKIVSCIHFLAEKESDWWEVQYMKEQLKQAHWHYNSVSSDDVLFWLHGCSGSII